MTPAQIAVAEYAPLLARMTPEQRGFYVEHPYLFSPAMLMRHVVRDWAEPPHIKHLNTVLTATLNRTGWRIMCNMPGQHGKTRIVSIGYVAWRLLHNPNLRIIVVSYSEELAREQIGKPIKDIILRFGPELGLKLRDDTHAGHRFGFEGFDGYVYCDGWTGGISGWAADIFVIDDLIAGEKDAMSPTILERHWSFYESVIHMRARNVTSILMVGTRWSKRDLFQRALTEAKKVGEPWEVVRFPAVAREQDMLENGRDMLGRKVGEALWPEQSSLENLLRKKNSRWWNACWQQEPQDSESAIFKVDRWPRYAGGRDDDRFVLLGGSRTYVHREALPTIVTVDWAATDKKKSDFTCMLVCGVTGGGDLLVLDCLNRRLAIDRSPAELDHLCAVWRPAIAAMESGGFQPAMAVACRAYKHIPEPRLLSHESKSKLVRAVHAVNMGEQRKIWLPTDAPWLDDFLDQVGSFNGVDDDRDDVVDCLSYAAKLAVELRGPGAGCDAPTVLIDAPQQRSLYQ